MCQPKSQKRKQSTTKRRRPQSQAFFPGTKTRCRKKKLVHTHVSQKIQKSASGQDRETAVPTNLQKNLRGNWRKSSVLHQELGLTRKGPKEYRTAEAAMCQIHQSPYLPNAMTEIIHATNAKKTWPRTQKNGPPDLWPAQDLVFDPKIPRKSLCGFLLAFLSQEMSHINSYLGDQDGACLVGGKELMLRVLMCFFCPLNKGAVETGVKRGLKRAHKLRSASNSPVLQFTMCTSWSSSLRQTFQTERRGR